MRVVMLRRIGLHSREPVFLDPAGLMHLQFRHRLRMCALTRCAGRVGTHPRVSQQRKRQHPTIAGIREEQGQ
jgi:hypothetical protein